MTLSAAFVTTEDPHGKSHGGTIRTLGISTVVAELGHQVEFFAPMRSNESQSQQEAGIRMALSKLKRTFLPMPTALGARDGELLGRVHASDADFVSVGVLSQVQYASGRPMWLDFMDVWSDFAAREALNRSGLPRVTSNLQARLLRRTERQSVEDATIVTAAGWSDWSNMKQRGLDVRWLPTFLPDEQFRDRPRPVRDKTLGFLGNFEYWPNVDAFTNLRDNWAPVLSSVGWRVLVAGHGSEALETGPSHEVEKLGYLSNLDEFYDQVSMTLAPIRLGGGMKVKILESVARGVPVAASPFALEGFDPSFREECVEVNQAKDLLNLEPVPIASVDKIRSVYGRGAAVDTIERIMGEFSGQSAFPR